MTDTDHRVTRGSRTEHYQQAYQSAIRGAPLTLAHLGPNDQTMRLARNGYEDGLADRPDDTKANR